VRREARLGTKRATLTCMLLLLLNKVYIYIYIYSLFFESPYHAVGPVNLPFYSIQSPHDTSSSAKNENEFTHTKSK
jgi:hypothetical protein